jgi:phosphotriesterase-related protein
LAIAIAIEASRQTTRMVMLIFQLVGTAAIDYDGVPTVETVTGPIDADQLGTTLVHEHLLVRDEAVQAQWPHTTTSALDPEPVAVGPDEVLGVAVGCARAVIDRGVRTICDPSCMFLGRDIDFMSRVARETGLQVVPCTGIYTYDYLPIHLATRDVDFMADLFVHDIEQGIQGTGIKAAFIKCAADEPGVTESIEKVHRAAARASLRTGTPIMAHSRPASQTGPRQIEIFKEEGVDPSRIQIAHTGDTDDLDYIERLLESGVWIGMDRYGLDLFLPFERRNATVLALLERGFEDRMFLSADYCATLDYYPVELEKQMVAAGAARDWSMTIVHDRAIPALRDAGATDAQIETMLVENPRRWLTGT